MPDSEARKSAVNTALDHGGLVCENRRFRGTAGVSTACRGQGYHPAFRDRETGRVYLSRFPDGKPAQFHTLEGLPEDVVTARATDGRVQRVKPGLQSGFVKAGVFYTREQALAQGAARQRQKHPCRA
ncbi:MAG: hypothetical protein PVJ15_03310 [Gammaproteobacteria bacterium]|jgi:hypothetical protein